VSSRCVQLDVAPDEVDEASGLLWSLGATGIQELVLGPHRVRLVAGVSAESEDRVVSALSARWTVDAFAADYDGWLDAWRPFARPVRAGRVVVHPPWEPPPWPDLAPATGEEADVVVAIDPGRAFGQGNHVTTRLMLTRLAEVVTAETSVLDVGCGSGVLAVTAALLGSGRVVAIDVEAEAARATRENADRNGVAASVAASTTPLADVEGRFDVVAANILASVLVELAPGLAARVAPGGRLLLSGLLAEQRAQVVAAFAPTMALVAEAEDDGWLRLELERGDRRR
jgi:ribosomal protein L11 methyltransferase